MGGAQRGVCADLLCEGVEERCERDGNEAADMKCSPVWFPADLVC